MICRLRAIALLSAALCGCRATAPVVPPPTGPPVPAPRPQVTRTPTALEIRQLGRLTLLSIARQPGYTVLGGFTSLFQRSGAAMRGTFPLLNLELDAEDIPAPGTEDFEALLDARGLPPSSAGSLDYLIDGKAYFTDFLTEVKRAKRSVDAEMYIFDNDDMGVTVANALRRKAEEIPVRVFYDSLGTMAAQRSAPKTPCPPGFTPPNSITEYLLHKSRLLVRRTSNPWLIVNHTKLQIIDKRIAYLGGMNFGREYWSEWHDLMVRVEGPIVGELESVFQFNWDNESFRSNWSGRTLSRYQKAQRAWRRTPPGPGQIALRILRTESVFGKLEIVTAMRLAIRGAKKRVWLETPYLTDDAMVRELRAAARRGVDVRVVFPAENDSHLMMVNNLTTAGSLRKDSVKVLMIDGMNHLKALLCDDWATIGSANMDSLSLRVNQELNLSFHDHEKIEEFTRRVFQTDFKTSRPVTDEEIRNGRSVLVETISDQF